MKHPFCSALLTLALAGSAVAQPIESYVRMIPTGMSLIANQLDSGGNTLDEIMPVVPDGSALFTYDFPTSTFIPYATYSSGTASWSPSGLTLFPGQGVFFKNVSESSFPLTFTGTRRVPSLPIPEAYQGGLHLLSAQNPEPGSWEEVVGLPPCGLVVVYRFNENGDLWDQFIFDPEIGDWVPTRPVLERGEAAMFDITPCPGGPPFALSCSADKTVSCGTDWVFDSPSARNACPGNSPAVNVLSTVTNGTCPMVITRTYEAVDACGNRASCTQTVTVADTTPPQVTCASDKTVECGGIWDFDPPIATDTCSEVTLNVLSTITNGTCPGTVIRSWELLDACGNRATCRQTVTINAASQGDLYVEDTPYNYNGAPDLGQEPEPNMAGQPMWMSRSIWVHQDYTQPLGTYLTHQNPRYGQTNGIMVKVGNRGKSVVHNAQLKVYVANASLGLSWPSGWTLIGTYSLPDIDPGTNHIAQVPWLPQGTGHYCLLARIVSDEDPMAVTETGSISTNVRANNNLAWRNVNVVNLLISTGQSTQVRMKPVRPHPQPVHGAEDPRHPGEKPPRQPLTVICRTEAIFHEGEGEATLNLGPWFKRWQDAGGRGQGITVVGENAVRITNTLARLEGIPMDEDEEAVINLVVKGPRPLPIAGIEHICHVELAQEMDGEEVGGVSYGVTMRALHTDTDHDGLVDADDPDDDNDGVADADDNYPLGEPDCPPSALTIRYVDGNMVLSWDGMGYRLESTPVIEHAWRPLHGAASPFIVAPRKAQQFFRLICH